MEEITYEMVEKVLAKFDHLNRKSAEIKIVNTNETSITDSKFGGSPYIPRSVGKPPMNSDDEVFILLAQFNLSQVPTGIFPTDKGILQFFIDNDDDLYGADYDDWTADDGFKVIFYPEIEDDFLSREEVDKFYADVEYELTPINKGEWGLEFTEKIEGLTIGDYRMGDDFADEWNKECPEHEINSCFDLPEELYERVYDERDGCGHKLLGYPAFTQADPREYDDDKREFELLFQMDSETIDELGCDILWGDLGIATFFIRPEQLAKLDFSEVAYNWDCG